MSGKVRKPSQEERKKINILLVDDIPETRDSVKKLLSFEPDLQVIDTATTGSEGVKKAKELKPDVILMDINMPDMDGLEATKIISRDVPQHRQHPVEKIVGASRLAFQLQDKGQGSLRAEGIDVFIAQRLLLNCHRPLQ